MSTSLSRIYGCHIKHDYILLKKSNMYKNSISQKQCFKNFIMGWIYTCIYIFNNICARLDPHALVGAICPLVAPLPGCPGQLGNDPCHPPRTPVWNKKNLYCPYKYSCYSFSTKIWKLKQLKLIPTLKVQN